MFKDLGCRSLVVMSSELRWLGFKTLTKDRRRHSRVEEVPLLRVLRSAAIMYQVVQPQIEVAMYVLCVSGICVCGTGGDG